MRDCSRQHSALWNTSHTWLPILTASLFSLLYRFDYLVSLENLCEPLFSILWVRGQEPGDVQPGCQLPEACVALYQFARAGSQQPRLRCVGHNAEGKDMEFMYLMNIAKPRWTLSCFEVFRQNQRSGEGHQGHTQNDPLRVAPYHENMKNGLGHSGCLLQQFKEHIWGSSQFQPNSVSSFHNWLDRIVSLYDRAGPRLCLCRWPRKITVEDIFPLKACQNVQGFIARPK